MSDSMNFPDTVEEFMQQYKVTDTQKVYTNGAELVPIFRMKQWFEHLPAAEPRVVSMKLEMDRDWVRKAMEEMKPTVAAEPRKGRWVRNFDGNEWYWFCSNCKKEWYEEDLWMGGNDFPKFCPNCGARMEESE